jgi:hypothetical protein
MSACHWERAKALQRIKDLEDCLHGSTLQKTYTPEELETIEWLKDQLAKASEVLSNLPDCSE